MNYFIINSFCAGFTLTPGNGLAIGGGGGGSDGGPGGGLLSVDGSNNVFELRVNTPASRWSQQVRNPQKSNVTRQSTPVPHSIILKP